MRPDRNDWHACAILKSCYDEVGRDAMRPAFESVWVATFLIHAIRHLVRPDRVIYPKTRRGTKRAPITRKP